MGYWIYYENGWSFGHKNYYLGAANGGNPTEFYTTMTGGSARIYTQYANSLEIVDSTEAPPRGSRSHPLTTGTWHFREELWEAESAPGAGDGKITVWVNGDVVGSNSSVTWLRSDDTANGFNGMEWYADVNNAPIIAHYRVGSLFIAGRKSR